MNENDLVEYNCTGEKQVLNKVMIVKIVKVLDNDKYVIMYDKDLIATVSKDSLSKLS